MAVTPTAGTSVGKVLNRCHSERHISSSMLRWVVCQRNILLRINIVASGDIIPLIENGRRNLRARKDGIILRAMRAHVARIRDAAINNISTASNNAVS